MTPKIYFFSHQISFSKEQQLLGVALCLFYTLQTLDKAVWQSIAKHGVCVIENHSFGKVKTLPKLVG
jgi:hypothetical protein